MRQAARRWRLGVAAVTAVLLSACQPYVIDLLATARSAAGVPGTPSAQYLDEAAAAKAAAMCAAGSASPSTTPEVTYGGETAVAVDELVGAAVLDTSARHEANRKLDATERIWQQWSSDPSLTDPAWDEVGVGEATCGDGSLYLAVVLRENPTMPASGRYSTPVYSSGQITSHVGLVYGTATDYLGNQQSLVLDLYVPPNDIGGPRPLLVYVHGGGFHSGSRTAFAGSAVEYARRGFVVASIDYRLRPNETPEEQLAAALDAIDDGMESIRWLKANAGTYGIDATRIGMLGSSAGGAIVLGVGHAADPTPGGPLAAYSPTVTGVVSTGAHLTPGLHLIDFEATDAPSMMFHYEQDTAAGQATWDYAYQTCTAIRVAGPPCDFIRQTGSGHTIAMGPSSSWWSSEIGPFLWHHLDLPG